MASQKDYRKANGRRVEGYGLAVRIAQEVKGMMLAQAFVVVKSAGFKLSIDKHDGVPRKIGRSEDMTTTIHVDVIDGYVRSSRASNADQRSR